MGSQAVQVDAVPEQLRHEYTQALHTALPLSYFPVLQGHAPEVKVRVGSQAVHVVEAVVQLRH